MANNQGRGNRGGGNRQNNRNNGGDQQHEYSNNEVITLQERLNFVLGQLKTRERELSATLPPDLPFDRFHATVNQALRNNPSLLECTPISIVNSCVKSAYDGLRLDGREAALVAHNVKIKEYGQPDRWEKQAQYFPMVFGLIQQVLRGGMVTAIEVDVIYQNDLHRVVRGSTPFVEHEPLLTGDRGAMIAAYSVAVFPNGYRSTIIMTKAEIEDVRAASKSGTNDKGEPQGIWKRWPTEMWKKTVVRRHRKTLPVARDIVIHDAEANDEFPGSDRSTPHPQLSAQPTTRRPTRAAIEHQQGTYGEPLDLGARHSAEHDYVDREEPREQQQDQRRETPREESRERAREQADVQIPEDDTAWGVWGTTLENKIRDATTLEEVDRAWREAQPIFKHAGKAIRDRLTAKVTERNADLALDEAGAGAGGGDN